MKNGIMRLWEECEHQSCQHLINAGQLVRRGFQIWDCRTENVHITREARQCFLQ
jgi:hypothetical protein